MAFLQNVTELSANTWIGVLYSVILLMATEKMQLDLQEAYTRRHFPWLFPANSVKFFRTIILHKSYYRLLLRFTRILKSYPGEVFQRIYLFWQNLENSMQIICGGVPFLEAACFWPTFQLKKELRFLLNFPIIFDIYFSKHLRTTASAYWI